MYMSSWDRCSMGAGVPRDQSVSAFPSAQFLKSSLATGNDRAGTRQVRPKPTSRTQAVSVNILWEDEGVFRVQCSL